MEEVEKKVAAERAEATVRAEQPAEGATPRGAKEAASSAVEPKAEDADAINAAQIEEAKAAGGEYQGQLPPEDFGKRPTVKDLATEKAPASGRAEQDANR